MIDPLHIQRLRAFREMQRQANCSREKGPSLLRQSAPASPPPRATAPPLRTMEPAEEACRRRFAPLTERLNAMLAGVSR